MKEKVFMKGIAEIILSVSDNHEMCLSKKAVCQDGHFSPRMLTAERLLQMRSDTLMRLLLYLAHTMDYLEFLCLQDCGFIVRAKNQLGNAVWLLQSAAVETPQPTLPQPAEPNLFDAIEAELAADSGESPSSWTPI